MSQFNLPRQKLSYKQKTAKSYDHTGKSWGELCTDAIINSMHNNFNTRRSTSADKQKYYDLFNNKINESDFEYVTKPFEIVDKKSGKRLDLKFPASLQPYDIVSPYFRLLIGEESKRTFSPIIRVINEDAVGEKLEQEKQMLMQTVEEILMSGKQQDPNQPQETPEQIISRQLSSIKDMREEQANHIIEFYKRSLGLEQIFQHGWKDYLIAGEELYCIDQVANEPRIRRVNPRELFFILPNNDNTIDKSTILCEHNRKSGSEIIDELYEFLTPAQIDIIEKLQPASNFPNIEYVTTTIDELPEVDSINVFNTHLNNGIDLYRCRWASYKEIGSYHFFDEEGNPQEMPVDETFIEDKSDPNSYVEWFWVKEYWESIRIGADMYLNIRPTKFRFSKGNNLSDCSSGYVGTVCDADNSKSVSLMARVYPWICNYLIMWYRTELLIATNIGSIAQIDMSLIPDDWDISQWLYYATAMKISFVNSFNESNKSKMMGQTQNQSTHSKTLDLDQGNAIQHHISMLQFIEKKIQDTTGITPQRLGAIESSELVGNTERAVVQSSHITEGYFYTHNHTKVRVLDHLLEVAKDSLLNKNKNIQYVLDDVETILLTIDGNKLNTADYGIFITNAAVDLEALAGIKQLLQAAIQGDKMSMSDAVKVYSSKSIAAIEKALRNSEQQLQQSQQVGEQKQQAHEKELQQFQVMMNDDNQEHDSIERQLDRENAIYLAEIKAIGNDAMGSEGLDTPSIIDTGKLALDHSKFAYENIKHQREMSQKDRELKSKETIENKKIQQTEIQNRNQERMQEKKIKSDIELANKKIQIEKIKARRKPASK